MRLLLILVLSWMALTPLHSVRASAGARKAVDLQGERYVPIQAMANLYRFDIEHADEHSISLASEWIHLRFEKNSRRILLNGTLIWLHLPVVLHQGSWRIADVDIRDVLDPLLRPRVALEGAKIKTILLDPGHGGEDSGAVSPGGNSEEKVIVLDLCRRLQRELEKAGFTVLLTRKDDRFLSLGERVQRAMKSRADLFVSIHLNSASSPDAGGVETFVLTSPGYPSTNSPESRPAEMNDPNHRFCGPNMVAGYLVQQALKNATGAEDRGLRRARFHVIKNAPCPAILVESGFLSNPGEEKALRQEDYRNRIAVGIATGIRNYANAIGRAQRKP